MQQDGWLSERKWGFYMKLHPASVGKNGLESKIRKKTNPELDINQRPKTINQTFPTPNIKVLCSAIDLKDQF